VFPSYYEGFGIPIIEAQSRGLPVIIYKKGKIPKEVRKYCFEAESPEHMAQIIENLKENGYNETLQKKATEYARSFTWKRCARETLEVYKSVYR
jgi:alpha-1,3-rhamnosyl/mannosyltransferase